MPLLGEDEDDVWQDIFASLDDGCEGGDKSVLKLQVQNQL